MDEQTLAALRGSIEKWKEIECHDGRDLGTANCPLCKLFFVKDCSGCPVREATGVRGCGSTPYDLFDGEIGKYMEAHDVWLHIAWTDELADLARQEREFLESLLPEGEAPCAPTLLP
jgi:hypothetical protein